MLVAVDEAIRSLAHQHARTVFLLENLRDTLIANAIHVLGIEGRVERHVREQVEGRSGIGRKSADADRRVVVVALGADDGTDLVDVIGESQGGTVLRSFLQHRCGECSKTGSVNWIGASASEHYQVGSNDRQVVALYQQHSETIF